MDKAAAARAIDAFLLALGRDPAKEPELRGTGARVAAAFADELCRGYAVDVDALLRENTIEVATNGVVFLRDIAVSTTCPHHLMLGTGLATVAYAPRGKILGVGALARLVDAFSQRLALQEAIGEEVVTALDTHLGPEWAMCRIVMSHGCMTARGERRHGAKLDSLAVRGDRAGALAAFGALP
jgi:GTP cyclohydrolase I